MFFKTRVVTEVYFLLKIIKYYSCKNSFTAIEMARFGELSLF